MSLPPLPVRLPRAVTHRQDGTPRERVRSVRGCLRIGRAFEHRAIAEAVLGRALGWHEVVHHLNEQPADNRLANLSVVTRAAHTTWRKTKGPKPALCGLRLSDPTAGVQVLPHPNRSPYPQPTRNGAVA